MMEKRCAPQPLQHVHTNAQHETSMAAMHMLGLSAAWALTSSQARGSALQVGHGLDALLLRCERWVAHDGACHLQPRCGGPACNGTMWQQSSGGNG